MKLFAPLSLIAVSACTAVPSSRPAQPIPIPRQTYSPLGLERVLGQTARQLTQAFGAADADVTEGTARKLQFGSRICVLDAYLYPKGGSGEPVVTHIDARQRNGSAIDRASCVAALSRREGGK